MRDLGERESEIFIHRSGSQQSLAEHTTRLTHFHRQATGASNRCDHCQHNRLGSHRRDDYRMEQACAMMELCEHCAIIGRKHTKHDC